MSHSGSPLVAGAPDCDCLGMDQAGVMQISVCLAEPPGVTALGSTERLPRLRRYARSIIYLLARCSVPCWHGWHLR